MKIKKSFVPRLVIVFLLGFLILASVSLFTLKNKENKVYADSLESDQIIKEPDDSSEDFEPYGLFASLSLSINGGNGEVWTTAKNDFTLFPSTVIVIVELYSSETYHELHTDMNLVSIVSTEDLDMGKTITAKASTGGKQMYWQGRMRYKVDNGSWKSEITGTISCNANGDYLGLL